MDERQKKGEAYFHTLYGGLNSDIRTRYADLAPNFGDHIVDFGYGDVMSNPTLGPREREIATLAALIVLGDCSKQLKAHVQAALNVGVSRAEIGEIAHQMAIYGGFPRTMNALDALREIFQEIDATANARET